GTILIVDDEEILRTMMTEILEHAGYSVLSAANGAEALALYREHQQAIDLVITDLLMPVMDGEELIRELKALQPDVKIIIATGSLDLAPAEKFLAMNVKKVITKPFQIPELLTTIRQILSAS
ncbi:MAG: response regulator, partial [Nitrospinota bacterium]